MCVFACACVCMCLKEGSGFGLSSPHSTCRNPRARARVSLHPLIDDIMNLNSLVMALLFVLLSPTVDVRCTGRLGKSRFETQNR